VSKLTPPLPKWLRPAAPRAHEDAAAAGDDGAAEEDGAAGGDGDRPGRAAEARESAAEGTANVVGWLDERSGISPIVRAQFFRKVPKGTNWFYTLGSATLFAFVSQAVTGVFLAMYYEPDTSRAYESASHITNEVFLGELVRGMHKWGSTVMIVLVFLHMARTFLFGAYKYPREIQWIVGVVLMVLSLVMGLTGYLLPFDQRSFWATTVATNLIASAPIIGPYMADFMRGGGEFGAASLARFYSLHMLVVPGLIAALIGAHLYLVAKLGTTAPPWLKADKKASHKEGI